MSKDISLPINNGGENGGEMTVAEFEPAGEANTAVIVVHEAFGLNEHIREVAASVSKAGHLALAPDFYHRSEITTAEYEDLGTALELMSGIDDENVLADIDACLDYFAEKGIGAESVGIVGFCMGGRIAYLASVKRKLGAGVTFYGGGIVTENITGAPPITNLAKDLQTPWLGLFGDLDSMIPTEGVEQLREALNQSSVANEIVRYPDVDHGFNCNGRPEVYNAEAAADARARTIDWFAQNL